jgi:hypothetical protein
LSTPSYDAAFTADFITYDCWRRARRAISLAASVVATFITTEVVMVPGGSGVPSPAVCIGSGLLFLVIGGGTSLYGTYLWLLAAASRKWPATAARITRSSIEQKQQHYEYRGWVTTYYPKVQYEFVVGGAHFTGDRIQFGGPAGSENIERAQSIIDYYHEDATTSVFYDPVEPGTCTLHRSMAKTGVFLMIFIGVATVALGITMLAIPHLK